MDTSEHSVHNFGKRKHRQAGFSLIEVIISIAIIAFAFIPTFGLIPTGVNTFRRAMEASVGAQIVQRVINDAQQTNFVLLTQGATGAILKDVRYFDDQGSEVIPANSAALSVAETQQVTYRVNTRVQPTTGVPGSTGSPSNTRLATVTIQVASGSASRPITLDSTTLLWRDGVIPVTTYSAMVSQSQ